MPCSFDTPENVERVVTRCGHIFCRDCILATISAARMMAAKCPVCRAELFRTELLNVTPEYEAEAFKALKEGPIVHGDSKCGAKICRLILELSRMKARNPKAKAVVVSTLGKIVGLVGQRYNKNELRGIVGYNKKVYNSLLLISYHAR